MCVFLHGFPITMVTYYVITTTVNVLITWTHAAGQLQTPSTKNLQ